MPLYLGGSINRFTIRFLLRGLLKADKKSVQNVCTSRKVPLYLHRVWEKTQLETEVLEVWVSG